MTLGQIDHHLVKPHESPEELSAPVYATGGRLLESDRRPSPKPPGASRRPSVSRRPR